MSQFHDFIQIFRFSSIDSMVLVQTFSCFLSVQIINPSQTNKIRLTIQYKIQIHSNIWTTTINPHNHNPKLNNISCRFCLLNFMIFLCIQLPIALNPQIKYTQRENNKRVLNIVIIFQNHIGSHLIWECINQKTHAHIHNAITRFLIFTLSLII